MLRFASVGVVLAGLTLGATTANMNMSLPTPGQTAGPQWATQLNAAFTTIDGHDHSAGKGVKVPTAGMNFNATPNFNGFGIADGGLYSFVDQGGSITGTVRGLYSAQSELWYGDGLGQQVQITSDGGLGRFAGGVCPFTVNSGTTAEFTVDCQGNILNAATGNLGVHVSPLYGIHVLGGAGRMQGLPTAPAPALATVGAAGTTSYSYYLVERDYNGNRSPVGAVNTITTGNATLSATNYITISLPTLPAGARCFDVLKTNTSTSLALCATATVNDTGQATSAYTPPTHNETADFTVDGYDVATQGVKFGDGTLQTTAAVTSFPPVLPDAGIGYQAGQVTIGQTNTADAYGNGNAFRFGGDYSGERLTLYDRSNSNAYGMNLISGASYGRGNAGLISNGILVQATGCGAISAPAAQPVYGMVWEVAGDTPTSSMQWCARTGTSGAVNTTMTLGDTGNLTTYGLLTAPSATINGVSTFNGIPTFNANVGYRLTNPTYGLHLLGGAGRVQGLATAGTATLATVGTAGTTSYSYYLVAKDFNGNRSPVGAAATITTGNATLSTTNYNTIALPALPTGAQCYDVLKTNTSTSLALCATATVNDTGQATSAYTPPTHNETADFTVDGYDVASGGVKFGDGTLQTTAAPAVNATTVQQLIDTGSVALAAGAATVTLSPAFSAVPICTCSDVTAANAVKCGPATATSLPLTGTATDTVQYVCVGNK